MTENVHPLMSQPEQTPELFIVFVIMIVFGAAGATEGHIGWVYLVVLSKLASTLDT